MYARAREERADLLAKEILEIADAPCKDAVEVAHAILDRVLALRSTPKTRRAQPSH